MRTTNAYVNGKPVIEADIQIHQDRIDITTEYEPDPNWTHTDPAGHFHAYTINGKLPTLKAVHIDIPCNGDECGGICEGEGYTATVYHCSACDARVEPQARRTQGRKTMPGLTNWSVDITTTADNLSDWRSDRQVSFWTGDKPGHFGFGYVTNFGFDSDGIATMHIVGDGELGQRSTT